MVITDAIISVLEWFFNDKCHILRFNSYECLYWWLKLSKMVYGLCRTVYFCFKSSFVSITFMSVYCHVASCHIMVCIQSDSCFLSFWFLQVRLNWHFSSQRIIQISHQQCALFLGCSIQIVSQMQELLTSFKLYVHLHFRLDTI